MSDDPLDVLATFDWERQHACIFAAQHAGGWWPTQGVIPHNYSRAASEWWEELTDDQKREWLCAATEADAANGRHLGLVYRVAPQYAEGIPEGHACAVIHHGGGAYYGGTDEYVDLGVQPSICHALAAAVALPEVEADGDASIWDDLRAEAPA